MDIETSLSALRQVATFLVDYLPLANSHNTDFIVDQKWESLPPGIAESLQSLSGRELIELPSCKNVSGPHKTASTTHGTTGTTSITEGTTGVTAGTTSITECTTGEITNTTIDGTTGEITDTTIDGTTAEITDTNCSTVGTTGQTDDSQRMNLCPLDENAKIMPKWDKSLKANWSHETLDEFLRAAKATTLPELGILTNISQICGESGDGRIFVDKFMSLKKSHEIDSMTEICHVLAVDHKIDKVADVGSGRGYLGCHLAMMHDYKVLGIDSSSGNTQSATTRSKRLQKQWEGLLKNMRSAAAAPSGGHKPNQTTIPPSGTRVNQTTAPSGGDSGINSRTEESQTNEKSRCFVPMTKFVTLDTDILGLMREAFTPQSDDKTDSCGDYVSDTLPDKVSDAISDNVPDKVSDKVLDAVSDNISDKVLDAVPDKVSDNVSDAVPDTVSECFMFTGLHTCGNLAPSILSLFVTNPAARVVCNVGCCYNHIEELFLRNPFLGPDDPEPEVTGFPMSEYLSSRRFQLGRNARMLAVQAPDRITEEQKPPAKSIFWRALLQVILRDLTGETRDDWYVGKIAAKCSNFLEYTRKAFKKLQIDTELSDEDILHYEIEYAEEERKMNMFFQLRATLSASIEALILLDRLLYLQEQECVREAHLIQLFDPVKSPRCYAIVGIKRN